MAIIFALPKIFDAVVARFTVESTNVPNAFGWRQPVRQPMAASPKRIVWVPGDPRGSLGTMGAAKQPGRLERSLGTLDELFHCIIVGDDSSDPQNERKQYQSTRELYDAWWRAVYLAMPGRVRVVSAEWLTEKNEARRGAALRVVCAVEAMIPDVAPAAIPIAPATTSHALVNTVLLDNTEPDTIPEA